MDGENVLDIYKNERNKMKIINKIIGIYYFTLVKFWSKIIIKNEDENN